jgi:esterase/lipase superfamily enzyme
MEEQYHKWYTQFLGQDFEMLVFGHAGFPLILFPAAQGRYYDAKDFGLISSAEYFLNEGIIKIYCPDTIDSQSWYNFSVEPSERVKTHGIYEKIILNDVIDFAVFETGIKKVALSGVDFGGYHALNTAFHHPEKISQLITLGSFFDIKQFIYGYYDDNCYFNNPPDYMPNLEASWYLDRIKKMKIILGTGEWDIYSDDNKKMSAILSSKNINHLLDIKPASSHDWNAWCSVFPYYLSILANEISS